MSYELIGLACLIVCDGLASLLGVNHLDFEVQSINYREEANVHSVIRDVGGLWLGIRIKTCG